MTPEEREDWAGEAEAEITDCKQRSRSEGWTFELRQRYLDASWRLDRMRSTTYWADDEPTYSRIH